jgi:hypothetical protein
MFSVGVLGAIGWGPSGVSIVSSDGSRKDPHLMQWVLAIEPRWHPLGARGVSPWVGIDLGYVAIVDSLDSYAAGGASSGSLSATEAGPTGGAAVGLDFQAASFLALGMELRGSMQAFGHQPPMLDATNGVSAHDFGTLTTLTLAVNGTFLVQL